MICLFVRVLWVEVLGGEEGEEGEDGGVTWNWILKDSRR